MPELYRLGLAESRGYPVAFIFAVARGKSKTLVKPQDNPLILRNLHDSSGYILDSLSQILLDPSIIAHYTWVSVNRTTGCILLQYDRGPATSITQAVLSRNVLL